MTAIAQRVDILTKGSAQALTPSQIANQIVAANREAIERCRKTAAKARETV